jgi:hypothetical protein
MNPIIISEADNAAVLDEIKESVRFELGGPIVDVELSDAVIESLIKRALNIMAKYSLAVIWHTEPITRVDKGGVNHYRYLDTRNFPFEVSYILDVFKSRGSNEVLSNTSDIAGIPLGWAIRHGRSSLNNYTDMVSNITTLHNERVLLARQFGSFKDSMTYDYDPARKIILIDAGYPASSNVTIEYVPIITLDRIGIVRNIPQAFDFLTQYSIALSMISLGRARGKFSVGNYDWSISSSELITSGQAKIDKLMEMVNLSYSRAMTD